MQRGDALAVRRQFEHVVAAIIGRDRFDPCRCMLFEIGFTQKTAVLAHEHVDLVRDLAAIKSVAAFLADQAQSFRERRIFENVAFGRRAAFAVERVSFEKRARQTFVNARTERPIVRDQLRDRKTFLGITNRRREIVTEFEFAKLFVQFSPCINSSGHADRQHPGRRNRLALQLRELGFHLLVAVSERRATTAVDAVEFIFFCAINDREEITADPVRDRLHQTKRRVCGDGGIDRAPAAFQDIESHLRRRRHARANHSVPRENFRARREIFSGDAIDLGQRHVRGAAGN